MDLKYAVRALIRPSGQGRAFVFTNAKTEDCLLKRFPWKTREWEIVYEVNNYVNNFGKQLRKQLGLFHKPGTREQVLPKAESVVSLELRTL